MDPNKENANPTVLDASELPSRRPASSASDDKKKLVGAALVDGGSGLFAGLVPAYGLTYDPFAIPLPSASASTTTASDSSEVFERDSDDDVDEEPIDTQEIYDLISTIADPEHPLSLGSLAVVNLPDIKIVPPPPGSKSRISSVRVEITPTITHCSLATVIGLGVRVRLEQALPPRFRVDVSIKEGTHSTAEAVSKQLADKERVAAALENATLMGVIRKMLSTCT